MSKCIISVLTIYNLHLTKNFANIFNLRRSVFLGGNGYRDESHNSPRPSSWSQHDCSLSGFGSEPGRTALFVPNRAAGLAALEQYAQRTEQRCKCGPSQLWSRPCFTTLIHCCLPDYSAPCNPLIMAGHWRLRVNIQQRPMTPSTALYMISDSSSLQKTEAKEESHLYRCPSVL